MIGREQDRMEGEALEIRSRARALETSEASLEAMAQRQIRQQTIEYDEALQTEKKVTRRVVEWSYF